MKMTLKLMIGLFAIFAISCSENANLIPSASIKCITDKDGVLMPLDADEDYKIEIVEYPNEGTMFEIVGKSGNQVELFIAVLPTKLEAKTYKLEIDDSKKSNLSYTLKLNGKTGYCCNSNSSGLLTITTVGISKSPEGLSGVIAAEFELEDGLFAKVNGSFVAVK
ncbi:MAG: hypothetical protein AB8B72_11480 [Crocinitomicaceae bacterium]